MSNIDIPNKKVRHLFGSISMLLFLTAFIALQLISCKSESSSVTKAPNEILSNVEVVGALKEVMQNGVLHGVLHLDSIKNKKGLYGLGPLEFLRGELLISDGVSYVSKVLTDTVILVGKSFNVKAPFFVFANVNNWHEVPLSIEINSIQELEGTLEELSGNADGPFVFKLSGSVKTAQFHIQDLPPGAKVSSEEEAHQGQKDFALDGRQVEIIGFYSKDHKGVFTHHDSNTHMHLITSDQKAMGHLDELSFEAGEMSLYFPIKGEVEPLSN